MSIKRRQIVLWGGALLSVGLFPKKLMGQNGRSVVALLKQTTIKILTPGSPGSGVLVHQAGDTYYFLTAQHVLDAASPGEEVYAVTPDGQQHLVSLSRIQSNPGVDLAFASFSSLETYELAVLGNSDDLQELDLIYVAGFPLATTVVPNPNIKISDGKIAQIGTQLDGYGLGYSANTQPGMSGGPVLNQAGQLVGIHGRAEGERVGGVRVKTGSNWAVPIKTAISMFDLYSLMKSTPSAGQNLLEKPVEQDYTFNVYTLNEDGSSIDRKSHSARLLRQKLSDGLMLDMVSVPGGKFAMGSPTSEAQRFDAEDPRHAVSVPGFYMSKYVVYQSLWEAVMGNNPSRFKSDRFPVENVTWNDSIDFCERLSHLTGMNYRLPSESEWEYACRAGTNTPFHFGETITSQYVNFNAEYPYALARKGEYRNRPTDVYLFTPNAFGLYGMHGNVWEWCQDFAHENYEGAPNNGTAWVTGGNAERRIIRGGSWYNNARSCRSANRSWADLNRPSDTIGIRLVLDLA